MPHTHMASPFTALSLDDTFGVLLIATFISLALYGLTLHQLYRYFRTCVRDSLALKSLVATVLILESLHTVMLTHLCYHYLISEYFNPTNLQHGVWSSNLLPCTSGLVIFTSQLFFVRRVFLLGHQYRAVAILSLLLFVIALAFNIAGTVDAYRFNNDTIGHLDTVAWMEAASAGALEVGDTLLTTVLVVALRRGRTGWKRMDSILDMLVLYAITTGLLTGVMNLFCLILSIAYPKNLRWSGFGIVSTHLYANNLLAALNSRESLARQGLQTYGTSSFTAEAPS
ncbi:hypothetical protein C8Q76DRAFT_260572 [Earliella scabrosa]|nr:hypothetical protein C8Q76DRAFT_260572 [Earliella scabrosa]